MKATAAIATLATALLLVACGSGSSGSSKTDRHNAQAEREQEACFRQAERIADQQGADAGSAKLDQCVDQFSKDLQVAP